MTLEALGRELAAAATAGDWTRVLELDSRRTAAQRSVRPSNRRSR
jgi:hypothetical protein